MLCAVTYAWPIDKYSSKSCTFFIELPEKNKLEQNMGRGPNMFKWVKLLKKRLIHKVTKIYKIHTLSLDKNSERRMQP